MHYFRFGTILYKQINGTIREETLKRGDILKRSHIQKMMAFLFAFVVLAGCGRTLTRPEPESEQASRSASDRALSEQESPDAESSEVSQISQAESEVSAVAISNMENNAVASQFQQDAGSSDSTASLVSDSAASNSVENQAPLTQTIIIPEGYTLARIGMLLEQKGICTADEFIAAGQSGDFSEFPLVAQQSSDSGRCFKLEGYLFPDTYEIYSSDPPETIIRRILTHTEQKITAGLRAKIQESGYSVDEIITLASIIEKEASGYDQMPNISSVLHNRLDEGMKLQCDVTINYVEGAIKPFISGDKNRYNSTYNTYKCDGLPAGAICNPGLNAIKAALNPADTDYFYFITDKNQNYYYAETWEEHLENLKKAGIKSES